MKAPIDMSYETQSPHNFLGLPPEYSSLEDSRVRILPVPYEATTSYGGGTRRGPNAILEASRQVELYDIEFDAEPALEWGIHTLPTLAPSLASQDAALADIEAAVAEHAASGRLLGVLGGEHSVSIGVARGLRRVSGDFLTVQLDAHADLRDEYEGSPYSHACAMRRVCEFSPVLGLGIRSLDREEIEFARAHPDRAALVLAEEIHADPAYLDRLADAVRGKNVFLTLDIDVFDPSLMPATGTPEPNGLLWNQVLNILRTVTREANVIAFDCVELAPIPGFHAPDFLTAKLIYKLLSLILRPR